NWRWMLGAGVVPALVLLVGMLFLPASPRWMVLKGWVNQARDVLSAIRYDQNVEEELSEIQRTVAEKHHHKTDWHALFQPWLRPALLVGFSLAFFQQMTGINTIIYYAPTIF